MLKKIPSCISGDLMKALMDMGHSDVIVFADANYPAVSNAKRFINAYGVKIPELLCAVLEFFPIDNFVSYPVKLMRNSDSEPAPEIWREYEDIIKKLDTERAFNEFEFLERTAFYRESQNAYAIVSTGTTARYANIMLQKGVV